MMCRQVLPDTNGIEQIYIVKSEPKDGENDSAPMAPEEVDQIKQEPTSEGEDQLEPEAIRKAEANIKEEAMDQREDGSNYGDFLETDEPNSGGSDSDSVPDERRSLKRKSSTFPNHARPLKVTQELSEERYACRCGMIYRKKSLLMQHKQICDIPESITASSCRFCQRKFPCYSDMLEHVNQLHGLGMPETKCLFCTDHFRSATLLVIHELRHRLPNVIKCEICNRMFRTHSNLQRHLKVHSNDLETFRCGDCGKLFTQFNNLEIHRRIHSGTRPCMCDLCPKSFYCSSTLRLHRQTHFKAHVEKSYQVSGEAAISDDVSTFTGKNEFSNDVM